MNTKELKISYNKDNQDFILHDNYYTYARNTEKTVIDEILKAFKEYAEINTKKVKSIDSFLVKHFNKVIERKEFRDRKDYGYIDINDCTYIVSPTMILKYNNLIEYPSFVKKVEFNTEFHEKHYKAAISSICVADYNIKDIIQLENCYEVIIDENIHSLIKEKVGKYIDKKDYNKIFNKLYSDKNELVSNLKYGSKHGSIRLDFENISLIYLLSRKEQISRV